jgi:hypothetical protein
MRALGWDRCIKLEAEPAALEAVMWKSDGATHQRLAYAGWLTFHDAYQVELQALRTCWRALRAKPPL